MAVSNISAPVVVGTPQVGALLQASPGSWSGSALTFAYQWQRANDAGFTVSVTSIGAGATSYTVTAADVGKYVRVVVTATEPATGTDTYGAGTYGSGTYGHPGSGTGGSASANSNVIGAIVAAGPLVLATVADTYSDGTASTLGVPVALAASALSLWGTLLDTADIPVETDYYYAALPKVEAAAMLGNTGVEPTVLTGECGWHYTALDDADGSYAIVKTGGKLVTLVGERVRITEQLTGLRRSVVAYVHREADLFDDISITRQLFAEIGLLSYDDVPVLVEVFQ